MWRAAAGAVHHAGVDRWVRGSGPSPQSMVDRT
jgi:hypothetical protein